MKSMDEPTAPDPRAPGTTETAETEGPVGLPESHEAEPPADRGTDESPGNEPAPPAEAAASSERAAPTEGEAASSAPDPSALGALVASLAAERDRLRDQLLRAIADLRNVQRRAQQEREEMSKRAAEDLVVRLLPVLDNLERAIQAAEAGAGLEALLEGVKATDTQLRAILGAVQLERIPTVGERFDPEVHEAILTDVSDDHADETVVEEIAAGYRLAGKVIRPARVRVAKKG